LTAAADSISSVSELFEKCPSSVTLAPVTDSDYELLCEWASSTSWVYARGSRAYLSPDEIKGLIEGSRDNFLMVRTKEGIAIGAVSWRTGQYRTSFEIGVMISDGARWQSGFGAESVFALLSLLFNYEKAHRIEFICGAFNKPVIQACCAGLIRIEGILRDYYYFDGTYHDAIICSILRDEYYSAALPERTVPMADIEESLHVLRDYLVKHPVALRRE
jgi:RimJ/RimL family protein N-acetyltransferase